jgi:hypothetical protein
MNYILFKACDDMVNVYHVKYYYQLSTVITTRSYEANLTDTKHIQLYYVYYIIIKNIKALYVGSLVDINRYTTPTLRAYSRMFRLLSIFDRRPQAQE